MQLSSSALIETAALLLPLQHFQTLPQILHREALPGSDFMPNSYAGCLGKCSSHRQQAGAGARDSTAGKGFGEARGAGKASAARH